MNNSLPNGFVYLSSICPDILQDIKYASSNNFTNINVAGYEAAVAILTKEAANALKAVQKELTSRDRTLLVFDAYRPTRAVDSFLKWRKIPDDTAIKAKYYPEFSKEQIFNLGFIASRNSSHSRGSTVDLTIVDKKTGKPLDMGTDFDFFGEKSNTDYLELSDEAANNRKLLKDLMEKHGFKNLPQEWWHYTLQEEPFLQKYFNFSVK